ncbi:hypothetical protein A8F94_15220 [Bacillus sp. FJAT-27225]|nr:hypothetical protein A8F94_15220 [Bacillus sp. FJAT-27225]
MVCLEGLAVAEAFIVVAVFAALVALAVLVVSSVVSSVVLIVLDVIAVGVNRSFQNFGDLKIKSSTLA